ncbi:S-layer homology domain-containing protein [Paenibacillus lignilyticus]|uniref:S-layer homology domain-containing protein n=1 Tax=Paenibacillus lignilyticus TaxID=1172615 RepID=A0ABS5CCS5_9BACL|nr:S-layer homology domain-containing protein [Paenibacillus lignilyticus]MBP3961574.1 S-layer homology domain-containing protein [Paenibacillus lignilyticus]MBP3963756.1 S-layer homology domain-containing protein [Paenibacillus lignilyticus]
MSQGQAWKTLDKVNGTDFVPGDQILFKAGGSWNGHLTIDDSGYGANRITFDKYGEGPKPIIAGGGVPKTIFLHNAEYVTIRNLEITNDAPENDHRYGIFVSNDTGRTLRSLHFESLDIHNVKGNYAGSLRFWSAAIGFNAYKSNSSYDDFLIADSHIYDNESHGIQSDGDAAVKESTFYTNVVIRNNFFERNGNGDIVVGLCDSPLIEYNTSYDQGGGFEGYGYTVSMWEWLSKNAVFQNNEVAYTNHDPLQDNDDGDSQAFDADIATVDRVTFQYNYSHDNAGGFLLVMGNSQENYKGATVRYNVSFNDHKTNVNENTTLSINHAGSEGSYIYNNVFYNNIEDEGIHIKSLATETAKIYYQNNIFYANAASTYPSASDSNNVFDYNGYFGTGNIAPVEDLHAVTADPKFADPIPAVPTDGMEGADVFKLSSDSPYINAGTVIADNGGRDFWGNALYNGAPDIGAHEYGSPKAEAVTVTLKPLIIPDAVDPAIHAGRWSVKAVSTGTASNNEMKQTLSGVQPNQEYKAQVWVKGTGGYTLSVGDGNTVIDQIAFEASSEWTQVQLPVNSGNSATLVYALTETGGAAGTAYFDDAFLGVADGPNLLENNSFEYGVRPWTIGNVFSLYHTIAPIDPDDPTPEPEPELPTTAEQVNDDFDSTDLNARWKWISEDPLKWSLSSNPGKMNIASSGGDVDSTKNVLLQWAPKGDFTIETKISAIPTADWEQTGLLVYIDGANHIKLNRVHDGELKFQFGYKQDGVWNSSTYTNINDSDDDNPDYYLKLEKRGATYTGYYSQDGTDYTKIGSYTVYFTGNKRIGLYNCNGTNVIADFDYFRMTSLDTNAGEPTAPPTTPPTVPNEAHSGDYAIKVDKNSAGSAWKSMGYNDIAVTPNTALQFKAWVKGSGKVKFAYTADWAKFYEYDLTATDEWKEVIIDFNPGTDTVINVSIKTTDASSTMFIDDVFLGTSGGENLIKNASFEDGSGPWWGVEAPFSLVEVIDANSKPEFYPLRDKSIRENSPLVFTIHATDKNENPLTYSVENLPAGAQFNASSRKFSWTPTYSQAGVYTVTFNVTDGTSTVSEDVQISVLDGPTPPTIPSTTPPTTPSPHPGTVKIAAIPDGNGKAVVEVKANEIQAALLDSKESIVEIIVEGAASAKEVTVNLSGDAVQTALVNKIKQFNINTGLAVISIPTELLKKQDGASGNVQLSVTNVDSSALSGEAKEAVGSHPVYDFNLSIDGKKISQFGDQAVTVKLNYKLKSGEDSHQIIIYYLNDNGKPEIVKSGKFDSATGQVTFSTKHFSKFAIAFNEVSFNDIANVAWAQDSIEALAARGIINGVGGDSFKPNDQLTRAAFITMLMNAFDLIDSNAKTSLSDVKKDTWYSSAIASAQQLGIVQGKTDGTFGVNDKISRQDMAVMLYNVGLLVKASFNGNGEAASFRDQSEIAAYAVNAVAAIQQAKIINGVGNGNFAPRDVATRAQAAVVIWNMFARTK